MRLLLTICAVFVSTSLWAQSSENAALNGWGFEYGAGSQSYTEGVYRISGFTPYLFDWHDKAFARLTLDLVGRDMQSISDEDKSTAEITVSLQSENALYKGILSSYSKIGIGTLIVSEDLYDGSLLVLPVSFGLSALVGPEENSGSSFFVEYRFNFLLNYDEGKSLPGSANVGLDQDVFDAGSVLIGFRHAFH
jgi:hypothetical protein